MNSDDVTKSQAKVIAHALFFFAFQTASVLALATKNPRAGLRAVRRAGAHAGKRKDEAGRMSQTR
jgi:hypothetical protein